MIDIFKNIWKVLSNKLFIYLGLPLLLFLIWCLVCILYSISLEVYDFVFWGSFALMALIIVCIFDFFILSEEYLDNDNAYRKKYLERRDVYLKSDISWYVFSIWLNSAGFVLPCIVIYIAMHPSENNANSFSTVAFYSMLSIVISFLSSYIAPQRIAFGYRLAFHRLESELKKTEPMEEKDAINNLSDAISDCENYITNSLYATFPYHRAYGSKSPNEKKK